MTLVMGVLNVTPDSFSDGGRYFDHDAAIAHGLELIAEGASVVDVGGESTRPGAAGVPADEEIRRVEPVVKALAPLVRVSVDTRKPEVATAALAAGATIINDVSASLWPLAAASGAGWVAMHMVGEPATMQRHAHYGDVLREVGDYLAGRAETAAAAGVEEIWIDPGIGFAKTLEHNLRLLAHLDQLVARGWPVLVGASRKSFLGRLVAGEKGSPAPATDRLEGSLAAAAWAISRGAAAVRVHDVAATVAVARLLGDRRVLQPARAPGAGTIQGAVGEGEARWA